MNVLCFTRSGSLMLVSVSVRKVRCKGMDDVIVLRFNISDGWMNGIKEALDVVEQAKEKHPDTKIQVEVQFGF